MTHEAGHDRHDPLGSVGEEAAKLVTALQDWAQDAGRSAGHLDGDPEQDGGGAHRAGAGPECGWCPVCQATHLLRQTSPEVRAHLAVAASSLLQAAAGLLGTNPTAHPDQGVRKIHLDDETSGDQSEWDAD